VQALLTLKAGDELRQRVYI